MSHAAKTLVIFDFDGTLSRKDSFLAFIKYVHGKKKFWNGVFRLAPQILGHKLNLISAKELKENFFAHFFGSISPEELQKMGDDFGQRVLPGLCFPEGLKILEWHRAQEHLIYVVSASAGIWLKAWCRAQKVNLIATQFEVSGEKFTGKIAGENMKGDVKYEVVKSLLNEHRPAHSFGYGDSKADLAFLSLLDASFRMPLNAKNYERWQQKIIPFSQQGKQ